MKRVVITGIMAAVRMAAFAEPSGDRPDATHAWAVHDVNRPDPIAISVSDSGIPSDAKVLFDGTEASIGNWVADDGTPTKWIVKGGEFICTPGSGSVRTKEEFADCQLHVEWKTPKDDLYGWGNSGVYLCGAYEIQILDSFGITPSKSPFKPANYADGQAGAVYGQSPCIVNPCRKTGEWQSFDIIFHPPRYDGEVLVDSGEVTVIFNGVLVQDGWKLEGPTQWCRRAKVGDSPRAGKGPIMLQDHGHPVPFRNIWIRGIPAREVVRRGEVAAKRHELAQQSAEFAEATEDPAERYIRLWEAYCYEPNRELKPKIRESGEEVVALLAAHDERVVKRVSMLRRFVDMLVGGGWMAKEGEVEKALRAYKAPPKPAAANLRDL